MAFGRHPEQWTVGDGAHQPYSSWLLSVCKDVFDVRRVLWLSVISVDFRLYWLGVFVVLLRFSEWILGLILKVSHHHHHLTKP
jgi:hypothetical protein